MGSYIDVAEAKAMSGMRLVLSRGAPGPWGEAAKNIFNLKGIPYVRVSQYVGLPNEELKAWTGMNNAPIAIHNDEAPVGTWFGILNLAERLSPEPSLIPADEEERARMFGLCHEICGEDGLTWNRRLIMVAAWDKFGTPADEPLRTKMKTQYGHSKTALRQANGRVIAILRHIADTIRRQKQKGSPYLVGNRLSAADIHFSTAMATMAPLPPHQCEMDKGIRVIYETNEPEIAAALDPVLLEFRAWQYEKHLSLPLDL
jgi:glutathione S-transferase